MGKIASTGHILNEKGATVIGGPGIQKYTETQEMLIAIRIQVSNWSRM